MLSRRSFAITALALAIGSSAGRAAPFTSSPLPHTTSWIGNSYAGAKKWVQQDIHAMAVTADGTVFTNVEWDEGGGQVGEYRDGELIRYARHTHGWGANGGVAIAVNRSHLFIGMVMGNEGGGLKDENTWPPKGSKWYGVSRRLRSDISKAAPFAGGKGGKGDTLKESFLVIAEVSEKSGSPIAGLCATEEELFAVDPNSLEIKVYRCDTMEETRRWKVANAGPAALDASGSLWVLAGRTEKQPEFHIYTRNGKLAARVALQDCSAAVCFAMGPNGRVYVFDDTPDQQARIYDCSRIIAAASRFTSGESWIETISSTGVFGQKGGICAGERGAFGNEKLNQVRALGFDTNGNLYLAHDGQTGGGGTVLESYSNSTLRWRLFGLTFVDMADADPASDMDIFTKEERFALDYAKPAGHEWKYAAFTVDRFRYPQDPRLHIWSAGAWVRRIAGQRILFVSDMNGDELQVYRFSPRTDGEIGIPSALFAKRRMSDRKDPAWPPHQPAKGEWMWRDANGNGAFDDGEYHQPTPTADAPASQGWWVDDAGGVWLATENKGIRYFPSLGLDPKGNPKWSYDSVQTFPHPKEFKHVKRIRYDVNTDALFLAGTTDEHKNQHWKPGGPALARYDAWLRSGGTVRWKMVAPYATGSQGHSSCEPMGFDVAGDYLFVPYTGASKPDRVKHGRVEVFRADDGSSVGHVEPSDDVGEIGLQDIRECLRAIRRSNGEHVIFLEDDYKSKVVMYRLRLPGESAPRPN